MILGFVIFLNYSGISKGALNGKNITLVAVFVTHLRDLSSRNPTFPYKGGLSIGSAFH